MPGPQAFQVPGFQVNAFQTGVQLGVSSYSLGALQIAIPSLTVKKVLTVNAYSLGSPSFAAPPLKAVVIFAAPAAYSLGSPSFATPALTAWARLVGGDYSLGSPAFAKPALTYKHVLSKPTDYSLGSPTFGTPVLTSISTALPVNPYSLGALTFGTPGIRFIQKLTPRALTLGSPSFAAPVLRGTHRFYTNAMALGALSWGTASLRSKYLLSAPSFALGGPDIASSAAVLEISRFFPVHAYSLGSPRFGFPRLQTTVAVQRWPLTDLAAIEDASAMLRKMLDLLLASIPPGTSNERNTVRRLVAMLRGDPESALRGNTLGTQLGDIFLAADAARPTLLGVDAVRKFLMTQVASRSLYTQMVFRSALIMTLGLESKIITRTTIDTSAQAKNLILYMRDAFDAAKAIGIDEVDVTVYQTLTAMSGTLIDHLARLELKLPRQVTYRTAFPMPSLYLANRIYADAARADEIETENAVVHPAFMPTTLKVLSDAGRTDR